MPLRNPFRRQAETPTLRERAAELRASLPSDRPQQTSTPAADSTPAAVQEPVATADPIFGAIEAHVAARDWLEEAAPGIDRNGRLQKGLDASDEAMAAARAAWDAANENEVRTWNALFEARPTTLAGAFAVVRHARQWASENYGVSDALPLEDMFEAIAEGLAGIMEAETASGKLVRDILDGWAAWGATLGKPQDDVEAEAVFQRADARRDDLIQAAMALPALPETIAAKALAASWMEWVCTERPGQPRDAYGPADRLVYDIHATIMGRGIEAGDNAPTELAAACDQAVLDWHAIQPRSRTENWGDDRLDEALDAYNAVFKRAIHEPSHTLSETQAKARLLLHDLRAHEGKDEGEEHDDKRLMRVVLREVAALADTVAVPEFRGIDFGPDTHIAELAAEFCRVYASHAVRDRAHMAGDLAEAEWEPSYRATVALMEKLEATQPKTLLGMALKSLGAIGMAGWNARADGSTDGMDVWERVGAQFQDALMADALAPISIAGPDLVGLVDFSAATMRELHAIHDMTSEVSTVAHAMVSSGRGMARQQRRGDSYDDRLSPAGNFMLWVAEALNAVEDAAYNEIKRRKPADLCEQEIRLRVLAPMVIANGDANETAAFARELLAFAEH